MVPPQKRDFVRVPTLSQPSSFSCSDQRRTLPSAQAAAIPSRDYSAHGRQSRPVRGSAVEQGGRRGPPTCHKDVARLRGRAAFAQELEQVPELAVDVAADRHRA